MVSESGTPVGGITVREIYCDYSAEFQGGEEDRESDQDGHVRFPRKTLWASALKRLIAASLEATAGVHASFGPHDYVLAFGRGLEGQAVDGNKILDWTGSPPTMRTQIVLRRTGRE